MTAVYLDYISLHYDPEKVCVWGACFCSASYHGAKATQFALLVAAESSKKGLLAQGLQEKEIERTHL